MVLDRSLRETAVMSTLTTYLTCTQPQYTKVKVLSTQDKQYISWAAEQSYAATAL